MGEFRVHHVRLFDYKPQAIHNIAYCKKVHKIALSRSNGTLEIYNITDNLFQEKVIPGNANRSVEAICWLGDRLFSAGLDGEVTEYDLVKLQSKATASSNAGPIWCLTSNRSSDKLAAGTESGCVVLFDITGDSLSYLRAFDRLEGRILCIAWHIQDQVIVTGGVNNIRLWNVKSGQPVQRLTLPRAANTSETIVWSIAILNDKTIVSGDSRGKTSFWNGDQGTLIKSYSSHKEDVLTVCVDENEQTVLSAGVDAKIVQYDYTPKSLNSEWKMWTSSHVYMSHTHDIRSLACAGRYVISGGVDLQVAYTRILKGNEYKSCRKLPMVPQDNLVHIARAAGLLMFQHTDYLEVWKLGHTNERSEKNGDVLALKSSPLKLLQLKSKGSETIVCSAISKNGKYITYSDEVAIRGYQLTFEQLTLTEPKISLNKMRLADGEDPILPAHKLVFLPSEDGLVSATIFASIQVIGIADGKMTLQHTFEPLKDRKGPIRLLSVSENGCHVAVADGYGHVDLFNLKTQKYDCSLPGGKSTVTAMRFSPNNKDLVIASSNQKITEYDYERRQFTSWTKKYITMYPNKWIRRHNKITHISFNPRDSEQIIVSDDHMICVIDKTQQFPPYDADIFKKSNSKNGLDDMDNAFHLCYKYKYVFHVDTLDDDWMVVVEKTPLAFIEDLPAALKQKKFGT